MEGEDLFTEVGLIHVGVDFGRLDAFVPQHLLYHPQIGTTLQKVRGKRMPEGVRADGAIDASHGGLKLHDAEHHRSSQCKTVTV